jgi:hypothetical protein
MGKKYGSKSALRETRQKSGEGVRKPRWDYRSVRENVQRWT